MNKRITLLISIVLIIGILVFLYYNGYIKTSFTVTPTVGCQFIVNPTNPSSTYTKIINGSNYQCNYSECIISGSMNVDKASSLSEMWYSCHRTGFSKGPYPNFDTCRVNCLCSGATCTVCIRDTPYGTTNYEANFNFCPSGDPSFPFCSGNKNNVSSSTGGLNYFTDEKKINIREYVLFNPKYPDNTDVLNRIIYSKEYDCSCLPAVSEGTACLPEQLECEIRCPTGKTFNSRTYCYHLDSVNKYAYVLDTCEDASHNCFTPSYNQYKKCEATQIIGQSSCGAFGSNFYSCPTGQSCYVTATGRIGNGLGGCRCSIDICILGQKEKLTETSYKECISIGNCLGWSSDITCPSDGNGQLIFNETVKRCVFPTINPCNPQESECVGEQIRYCKQISIAGVSGYQWERIASSCQGELKCWNKDNSLPDDICSCRNVDSCTTRAIQCISETNYKTCSKDPSNLASTCLAFRDLGGTTSASEQCVGNQIITRSGCDYSNPPCDANKDCLSNICKCKTTGDYCTVGTPNQYLTDTTYKSCVPDDVCYKWVVKSCPVGELYDRNTNQCYPAGCAFGTPGYECSTQRDLNNILVEKCDNNRCVAVQDENSATEVQFLNLNTRCSGNKIQKVSKYTGKAVSYRWETKTDVLNAIDGVCNEDFICVQLSGGQAQCGLKAEFVGIIAESYYGINNLINGILISLTDKVSNRANMRLIARLLEGTTELKRIDTFTDSQGKVTINFNYAHPRSGELIIEVTAGDPAGQNYKSIRKLNIASTLQVKINCPAINYIRRDITCSWVIRDIDTNSIVSTAPIIKLIQGTEDLIYSPYGNNGIVFKTDKTGSVLLKVSADKLGYVSGSDETTISVSQLTRENTLEIDNKDIFTYSTTGVSTGTHQLKIFVEESGVPIEIQTIDATITTPSGQIIPIIFNRVSSGIYQSSYNFVQAGNTYILAGTINFVDLSKEPLIFDYRINTIQSTTEDIRVQNTMIYISIGSAILVLIITIILVIYLRKKRK